MRFCKINEQFRILTLQTPKRWGPRPGNEVSSRHLVQPSLVNDDDIDNFNNSTQNSTDLWRVQRNFLQTFARSLVEFDVLHVSVYIFNLHRIAGKNFQEERWCIATAPNHAWLLVTASHSIWYPKNFRTGAGIPKLTHFARYYLDTCHVIVQDKLLNRENGKKLFDFVIFSAIRNT